MYLQNRSAMEIEQIKNEVLQYLFKEYLEQGGKAVCDVSELITGLGKKPEEVGRYLVKNKWVKNSRSKGGVFEAGIDIEGIREIKPEYLKKHFNKIMAALGSREGAKMSLMKILGLESKDAQLAFDLGRYISSTGYVNAKFSKDDVSVQLNPLGTTYYEENKLALHKESEG
jgi:hypothetical protein